MSGGGDTRVSIPSNVKGTIQNIREITKKQHTDDEIYAVLRECSMDPNETAQKLLYLDTFHEVKRRKDWRKESPKGTQRRVSRGGGQGNYTSSMSSDSGGGGRNFSAWRDNGANNIVDRGSLPSSVKPVLEKTKNIAASLLTKASTGTPNGLTNLSNGNSIDGTKFGDATPCPADATPIFGSLEDEKPMSSVSSSTVHSSASDPAEPNHLQENEKGSGDAVVLELPKSVKIASRPANSVHKENTPSDGSLEKMPSECDKQPQLDPIVPLKVVTPKVATTSQLPPASSPPVAKHVTFPHHILVPEGLKNVLTFGSIDATFGLRAESVNGACGDNLSIGAIESSQDTYGTAKEPSPSNDVVASHVQGDFSENPLSLPNVLEKLPPSDGDVSSSTDSKTELPKQDVQLAPDGPQNPTALIAPSYKLGFFPPMLGNPLLPVEGHDNPAHEAPHLPNFVCGNSAAVPSPNSTPPLPSTLPVSQQSIPVYRQTYPANFYPYGPYLSPYYMPPPMHQFLSPNGFPPQPSAGNVFLPPSAAPASAAAAGVKYSLPHFKGGANGGNPTQYSIQSSGSFVTTPGGYAPGSAVTSGSSVGSEDLGQSQLKENHNHIYTTGQLTEGAVWIHAPGQDLSGLQVSSMYNLPGAPRLTFSPMQAGHGAMPGMYPPGQTIASTFLQQSQAVAGATETVGPPQSAVYQQQLQQTQLNWN